MFRKELEMKLLQNLKKDKKGFTLIEMIVVIVIIGILLAILVPGMFKYIEKAKNKQIMVEARSVYMDIQTAAAEAYGTHGVTAGDVKKGFEDAAIKYSEDNKGVVTISVTGKSVSVDIPKGGEVTNLEMDLKGKITSMTYKVGGKKVTLSDDSWSEPTEATTEAAP